MLIGYFSLAFLTGAIAGTFVAVFFLRSKHRKIWHQFRVAEKRFEAIVRNAPAEIYLKDEEGRYLMVNHEFERLFNVKNDEITGLLPTDVHDEELGAKTRAHDLEVLRDRTTVVRDELAMTSQGLRTLHTIKFPTFDKDMKLTGIGAIVTDVTDLRASEFELRQFQKTEAIGQLTGGIAHDFNNLLAIVMGNLELMGLSKDEAELKIFVEEALEATRRGASLTKSLLSFARKSTLNPETLFLNELVVETEKWCTKVMPENVKIAIEADPNLRPIRLDRTFAQTAFLNILLNARDAMEDGGTVDIKLSNIDFLVAPKVLNPENFRPGKYVCISISDDGEGIEPSIISEVFSPFFTTKPVGAGSGLGLSMVYGFVKQSGAMIELNSKIGFGSVFSFYFEAVEDHKTVIKPYSRTSKQIPKNRKKILLAEDDKQVRKMLQRHIEKLGYQVVGAENGDAAHRIFFASEHFDFDLLVTDIVMPGRLQGPSLANDIRSKVPGFPVVFLSGYAQDNYNKNLTYLSGETFLMKPVRLKEIQSAIMLALKNQ